MKYEESKRWCPKSEIPLVESNGTLFFCGIWNNLKSGRYNPFLNFSDYINYFDLEKFRKKATVTFCQFFILQCSN